MAVTIKKKGNDMDIFCFGQNKTDGNSSMKDVLGGKGANLAEMASLGLPVPPGFTIPCKVSMNYQKVKSSLTELAAFGNLLKMALKNGLDHISGHFGGVLPLLSVRSGARVSMPGMMDTILNVGLTSETLPLWKEHLGDRAALDCYRRLIQMFSSVALGVSMEKFENELHMLKKEAGVTSDSDLDAAQLDRLVSRYLEVVSAEGLTFPDTLEDQLVAACIAVFSSWNNPRAIEYRKIHGYSDDWGTAVNVQAMVFGNRNDQSATGVLFTRCPSTGSAGVVGEYLVNAQGEDVVAGIRTPEPLHSLAAWDSSVHHALQSVIVRLEEHYKDMQDVEFTVESGKLYILQTRSGKRTPKAAFRIAHDMYVGGFISLEEALSRVSAKGLFDMMTDSIDPSFKTPPALKGIAAGGGVVSGIAVFDAADAVAQVAKGAGPVILIRKETDPDDIAGMNASVGILTATGGLTSHAAVVARGMNKSCVVGATDLAVGSHSASTPMGSVKHGEWVTIDGATGNVWFGVKVPVIKGSTSPEADKLVRLAAGLQGATLRATFDDLSPASIASVAAAEGALYLDTALFDDLPVPKIKEVVSLLGKALQNSSVTQVVIDLTSLESILPDEDRTFSFIFGQGSDVDACLTVAKAEALAQWPSDLRDRSIVVMGKPSKSISGLLAKAGYAICGKAATVADLLAASGPVEMSEEVISSVFGTKEAYDLVSKLIEAHTGKKLGGVMPVPRYWFEVLGAA